jgi:hypothetical protein
VLEVLVVEVLDTALLGAGCLTERKPLLHPHLHGLLLCPHVHLLLHLLLQRASAPQTQARLALAQELTQARLLMHDTAWLSPFENSLLPSAACTR